MTSFLGRSTILGTALVLGLFGASALGSARYSPVQGAASRPSFRFVNLNKVLVGWDYAKKLNEDFKLEFDSKTEALQARQKALQKKRDEIATLQASGGVTDETRRRERELSLDLAALDYDLKVLKNEKTEKRLRILLSEYQQIQAISGKWAEKNGIDAVFVIQEEDAGDEDLQGRYERAIVRQVLWYSKDLDVTDDVLKLLQASEVKAPSSGGTAPAKQDKK